ncbi:DUF4142 domain-containing protein, partial [Glaciimonas sp. Cout2]
LLLSLATVSAYAGAPETFVEEASAKGMAEIQTSQLAMDKSKSADVKSFAQMMITDHTDANQKLAAIATGLNLKTASDAEMMDKAK